MINTNSDFEVCNLTFYICIYGFENIKELAFKSIDGAIGKRVLKSIFHSTHDWDLLRLVTIDDIVQAFFE